MFFFIFFFVIKYLYNINAYYEDWTHNINAYYEDWTHNINASKVGFEPTISIKIYWCSKSMPSTTQPLRLLFYIIFLTNDQLNFIILGICSFFGYNIKIVFNNL